VHFSTEMLVSTYNFKWCQTQIASRNSSGLTSRDEHVWFEYPERNSVVGFKIMNQMRPAGFNTHLVLRIARNPESGLGTGGHSCLDSSYNVYFIYLPSTKTA